MREIKFRAWDKTRERLRNVIELAWNSGGCYVTLMGFDTYMLDEIEIMQYTGLKDKNGKEIYECDLLNMHYRNESVEKGKVVTVKMGMTYDSDGWEHERTYGWVAGNNSLADVAPYAEVLGNIYENPELLEEED